MTTYPQLALTSAQTATMSGPQPGNLADVDHITLANLERFDQRTRVCPDWRKEDIFNTGLYRLSNDLHPAFEASRFLGPRFSLEDTLQARRFASRLLDAECCIPFWWALMDGDDDDDPSMRDRRERAARMTRQEIEIAMRDSQRQEYNLLHLPDPPPSDRAPEQLTCCQITKTKIKLRLLAHQVHYLVDVDANSSRCDTAWFSRATPSFHGSPSSIVISAKRLRAHSAAMEGDLICQTWASVSLGFRLLQLLAHAAVGAAHSGPECHWSNKYAFNAEPNLGAEIRMLEACTFGGVLRREQ